MKENFKIFKEKTADYYLLDVWYKIIDTKTCQKKKKDKIKEYQINRRHQLIQYKKEALQDNWALFLFSILICEKILKFDNIRVKKKEFHKSKQPTDLDLTNVDQIVVSDKFKHNDDGFKYFIGYKECEIVKPLCILPQMTDT